MAETYQVTITEPARKDLEEILDYILDHDGQQRAEAMRQAVMDAIYGLKEMPERHGLVKEVAGKTNVVYRRVAVKKKYKVIYRAEEPERNVFVIRILHVKRGPGFVRKALE